jgi:hypothetical protein
LLFVQQQARTADGRRASGPGTARVARHSKAQLLEEEDLPPGGIKLSCDSDKRMDAWHNLIHLKYLCEIRPAAEWQQLG